VLTHEGDWITGTVTAGHGWWLTLPRWRVDQITAASSPPGE
jgi:hypothetical protein